MALPNLQSTYSARRSAYDTEVLSRRAREYDHQQRWSQTAQYFKTADAKANVQKNWESDVSFHSSMDAYKRLQEKDKKDQLLKLRRERLKKLFAAENTLFEEELHELTPRSRSRTELMKERSESLKSAREERRQQVASDKLYEHFRLNNPDLRQLESRQLEKHVIGQWGQQKEERDLEEEAQRLEEAELEREIEEERTLALDLERQIEQEKQKEQRLYRDEQRRQIEELKMREEEAEKMKAQEKVLAQQQIELDLIDQRRKLLEEKRKKLEFGKVLLRQHAAALKRRSKQIQEELTEDLEFLDRLADQERTDTAILTSRKQNARADATWMQQVLEEQLQLERVREAELDQLYHDEAAKVWNQREQEWAKERVARERLIQEVMLGRQEQIKDHIEEIQRRQEESLKRRENLIRDLEIANQLTKREEEERGRELRRREEELRAQMTSRMDQEFQQKLRLQEELEDEKAAQRAYEKLLKEEAKKMEQRGYQPKTYGKRQPWS